MVNLRGAGREGKRKSVILSGDNWASFAPFLLAVPRWSKISLQSISVEELAFMGPFYFIYFFLVLLLGALVFFVLNRFSKQREEEKKKAMTLKKSLAQVEVQLAKGKESLPILSKMAEKVLARSDIGLLEADIQSFMEKTLKIDLYSMLVLNKRKKTPLLVSKNIPPSLLEEISRASLSGDVSGPFEEGSLTLGCIRLFDLNEVLGAFFTQQEVIDSLSAEDVSWLNLVAMQLVLMDKGKELDLRAEELLTTEKTRSLFNYQFFRQQLETEWERAKRYNRCLSLVVLDIDDLNVYEETFGQEQKEFTLAEISQLINNMCRRSDVVAHYVGDELAVILPETDVSGAFVAAERIRETIFQQKFLGRESKREAKLTMSLGVANYPLNTADLESLTREVESALYNAKITGRNRVCGPELPA